MSKQIEALKLALEALECLKRDFDADQFEWGIADEAITAIKEALREHAMREVQRLGQEIEQEPCDMGEMCLGCSPRRADGSCPDAKPWVGLTDEEMTHTNHHMVEGAYQYSFKQGAKWAEAKLKEKNT